MDERDDNRRPEESYRRGSRVHNNRAIPIICGTKKRSLIGAEKSDKDISGFRGA